MEIPLYDVQISVGYAFFTWYIGYIDEDFKQALYECLFCKEDTTEVKVYESGTLTKHLKVVEVGMETDKA